MGLVLYKMPCQYTPYHTIYTYEHIGQRDRENGIAEGRNYYYSYMALIGWITVLLPSELGRTVTNYKS